MMRMKIEVVDHVHLEEEHIKKLQALGDHKFFKTRPRRLTN